MVIEFYIVGGHLKIQKSVFVQEMLIKGSLMRSLLNWKGAQDFTKRHPLINEADENNIITINYDNQMDVSVGESPKEVLGNLKARYREKIKGKVACRAIYSMYGGVFTFTVDLNSDDDKIDYIMN